MCCHDEVHIVVSSIFRMRCMDHGCHLCSSAFVGTPQQIHGFVTLIKPPTPTTTRSTTSSTFSVHVPGRDNEGPCHPSEWPCIYLISHAHAYQVYCICEHAHQESSHCVNDQEAGWRLGLNWWSRPKRQCHEIQSETHYLTRQYTV